MYKKDSHAIRQTVIEGECVTDNYYIKNGYNNGMVTETKFINFSSEYIAICFRDGTYTILTPIAHNFIGLDTLVIGHSKRNGLDKIYVIEGDEHKLNSIIRDELNKSKGSNVYWEETIPAKTITAHRNGLYLVNSDVTAISASQFTHLQYHPFCKQNVHLMHLNLVDNFDASMDISISIRAIDTLGQYPNDLYVILNNRICYLKVRRDSNLMASGVYISGLPTLINITANDIRRDQHYSFDTLLEGKGPILMFMSLHDARTKLNELRDTKQNLVDANAHETLILSLKRETEKLHAENLSLKIIGTREKEALLETELKKIKELQDEKALLEKEYLQQKEKLELEKNRYKLQAEGLKITSLCLTVAFTLYKLIF